jgi:DNA (cytosine-5)-methyltransferase 1
MLTVGDLFSGIGGFSLGLERAGMRTAWFAEVDPYASAVLKKHWPEVPNHGDVRGIRRGTVEPVDILCGGFPCQDVSVAGKGAGIDGPQSGLWAEFDRLVGELEPDIVLIENVPALRTRGADRVLGDLERRGYSCWSFVVGSVLAGAPFVGERCWIVAAASGSGLSAGWEVPECAESFLSMPAGGGLYGAVAGSKQAQREWESPRLVESPVGGSTDGLPARLVRLANAGAIKALGNSIDPRLSEIIGRAIVRAA